MENKFKFFFILLVKFGVFVKDCSNEFKIFIEIEFIIDKLNKIKVILNYGWDFLLLGIV